MKTIHKALKIWKCNISILLFLFLAMSISLIYQIVIFALLFLMWPFLFLIGTIILNEEKFNKWIEIYEDNIPEILEDK